MPRIQAVRTIALVPPPIERRGPDRNRIYAVRGLDALWHARRAGDGVTVATDEEKSGAVNKAKRLGYIL